MSTILVIPTGSMQPSGSLDGSTAPTRLLAAGAGLARAGFAVLTPDLLTPTERVDAVVSGDELGTALAEELARLEPFGVGNPSVSLLVPATPCST